MHLQLVNLVKAVKNFDYLDYKYISGLFLILLYFLTLNLNSTNIQNFYNNYLIPVQSKSTNSTKVSDYPTNKPNFNFGNSNLLLISKSSTKNVKIVKPVPIVPIGPAQPNSAFATYPTFAQNFANYNSNNLQNKYWNIVKGIPDNSNNEAEYYTNNKNNLSISNGELSLTATQQTEPNGYKYASARIDTQNKQSFLYGRIDITAQIPTGTGLWPAAWLLPANNKYENLSPSYDTNRYLNGGEMDLIEEVGYLPNQEYGIVHTLADLGNPNGVGSYQTTEVTNGNTAFNTYSLLWTPNYITFEVNNLPFYTYTRLSGSNYYTWPFDQPFYLILNLAVGGSWVEKIKQCTRPA